MNSLDELKLQQELKGAAKHAPEYQWTQAELDAAWRQIARPLLGIAEILANAGEPQSIEEVRAWQALIPADWSDLADMKPQRLVEFCRELRVVWAELEALAWENKKIVRGQAQELLQHWWTQYPLKSGPYWNIYFQTGTFFPAPKNTSALIARVCFDNREHLGVCQNPDCKRYFIKPRRESKFCKNCRAYDNKLRQSKLRDRRKKEKGTSARKSRKRVTK